MRAIELLSDIVAYNGPWRVEALQDQHGYEVLAQSSLIKSNGLVSSVLCEACDDPHDAAVAWSDPHYGYFCDEAGFVTLDRSSFESVSADIQAIVASIAACLECKNRKTKPIHGKTFRIGVLEFATGDLAIYFHPRILNDGDLSELNTAMSKEVRTSYVIVLTAAGHLVWGNAKTARLSDVFEISEKDCGFKAIADIRTLAGIPEKRSAGRPTIYHDKLFGILEERTANGSTLPGVNEEKRALRDAYASQYPGAPLPSDSTLKRSIREFRSGSKMGQN